MFSPAASPSLPPSPAQGFEKTGLGERVATLFVKLFGKSPIQGFVAVQDPERRAELRMHFDPTEITHLGLWLNFGGWSGVPGAPPYYNLGLEPCIGAQDDLAVAYHQFKDVGTLPPNGRRNWQLDLIVR